MRFVVAVICIKQGKARDPQVVLRAALSASGGVGAYRSPGNRIRILIESRYATEFRVEAQHSASDERWSFAQAGLSRPP
jgi:hypothetical protein